MKNCLNAIVILFSTIQLSSQIQAPTQIPSNSYSIGSCNGYSYEVTKGICSSGFLEFTVTSTGSGNSAASIQVTFPGSRVAEKTGNQTQTKGSTSDPNPVIFGDILGNVVASCTFRTFGCDALNVTFEGDDCNIPVVTIPFLSTPVAVADPCNCNDPQNVLNPDGSVQLFHDVLTFNGPSNAAVACATNCGVILDNAGNTLSFAGVTIPPGGTSVTVDFWRAPGTYAASTFTVGGVTATLAAGSCDGTVCNNNVPTMGQWGLIILSFLLLIMGTVAVKNQVRIKQS